MSHPLCGEWVGVYGGHGQETIKVDFHPELPRAIAATKITGDANVPANQITWWVNDVDEHGCGKTFHGKGQIAETGYQNPQFVDATLHWQGIHNLSVSWAGFTINFTRKSYNDGFLHNLLGDWTAVYGGHGLERVRVHFHPTIPKAICATKITGDTNVPAGQVTWWVYDGGPNTTLHHGQGQIADSGFRNPRYISTTLQWYSNSVIDITWVGLGGAYRFTKVSSLYN